ncbi:MAG: phosphate acyltransferase PlsX [Candidatus Melainabacteria bacterium]|nr:phosphate acyltransferase PlsX [Candidatus Melainabacteria bacterium]
MSQPSVWIAVDAMGGDFAPQEIVAGALRGSQRYGVGVFLVGKSVAIQAEIDALKQKGHTNGAVFQIIPADEVVEMGEEPVKALRQKKNASIAVTAQLVRQGKAQAMVAAGSTGAAMASATTFIGRIKGIKRPAIAIPMPGLNSPCLMLDAGANAECTSQMLLQFAHMGSLFMESVFRVEKPRVGLLNIGEEPGKGNTLCKETLPLLMEEAGLNVIGNVEGKDIFWSRVDVAVCDGFTGNVALKSAEGIVTMVLHSIKTLFLATLWTQLVGALARPILGKIKKKVHPEEFGGALLLGIDGICVISHGGSTAYAIENAIRVAEDAVRQCVIEKITKRISETRASSDIEEIQVMDGEAHAL